MILSLTKSLIITNEHIEFSHIYVNSSRALTAIYIISKLGFAMILNNCANVKKEIKQTTL